MIDFKPSQIVIDTPMPFIDTFKKSEAEVAAALIVLASVRGGGEWAPVFPHEIGELIRSDPAVREWLSNTFVRPDVYRLIADGFAEWVGEKPERGDRAVRLTDKGLEALRRWVRP